MRKCPSTPLWTVKEEEMEPKVEILGEALRKDLAEQHRGARQRRAPELNDVEDKLMPLEEPSARSGVG